MNYVTSDTMNEFLRNIHPMYGGKLGEIQKTAYEKNVPIIPLETARLLTVLLTMQKPKNILEVGTAIGFSSSLMSLYLEEGGHITTIDRFDVMYNQAEKNIADLGLSDTITILKGDANDILPTLTESYDVIFLDAGKGQYINFLPHCMRLLRVGGLLLVDDVLQGGTVAENRFQIPRRQRTIHTRLKTFLWEITHMEELETSIVPIGDGLAVCYKKKEWTNTLPLQQKGMKDDE